MKLVDIRTCNSYLSVVVYRSMSMYRRFLSGKWEQLRDGGAWEEITKESVLDKLESMIERYSTKGIIL